MSIRVKEIARNEHAILEQNVEYILVCECSSILEYSC